MDQDQDALSPTALVWDRNGELRSEDLEQLLKRLQAQEVNSQRQEVTPQSRRGLRHLMAQAPRFANHSCWAASNRRS